MATINSKLCVIANGISSRCISFGHHHPHNHCHCEECRQESACCCREIHKESICGEEETVVKPEIIELRDEIRRLSRSVHRLSSLIKVEEPHREHKEVTKKEKEEGEGRRTRTPQKK
jgi:hypothetical protein